MKGPAPFGAQDAFQRHSYSKTHHKPSRKIEKTPHGNIENRKVEQTKAFPPSKIVSQICFLFYSIRFNQLGNTIQTFQLLIQKSSHKIKLFLISPDCF